MATYYGLSLCENKVPKIEYQQTTFQYFSILDEVSKRTLVSCPYPWCFTTSLCLSVGKNSCGVWSPWRNTW